MPTGHSTDHARSQTPEHQPALLYTAEEAATILRVRPSWLRRKASARAIPCRFIGKHLRFSFSDLEEIAGVAASSRADRN